MLADTVIAIMTIPAKVNQLQMEAANRSGGHESW